MKFSRLGLIFLLGVMGSAFAPLILESSVFSLVVAQTNEERFEEAERLYGQGDEQYNTSQFQAAFQSWQAALEIYREIGNQAGMAKSLNNLGIVYSDLGQYETAIDYFKDSLVIQEEIDNQGGMAKSLNNLGIVYNNLGQYKTAIEYHQKSLNIKQEIGDKEGIADSLNNLGAVYLNLGQYEQAIEYFKDSLVIQEEIDNQGGMANSLLNLGIIYDDLGQYEQAIEYFKDSLAIVQDIGNPVDIASSLNNLGIVYKNLGQYEQAIDYYQQSLAIVQDIGYQAGEADSFNNLGVVYYELGQYEQAIEYQQKSLAIQQKLGNPADIADSFNNLGLVYTNLGQYEQAIEYHQRSLVIQEEIDNQGGMASSLNNLGIVYMNLGQYEQAIDYYQRSLVITEDIGYQASIADSLNNLGEVYRNLGQYKKAIDYYQRSLAIQEKIGNQAGIANSLNNLGIVYMNLEQYEQAIDYYQRSLAIYREVAKQGGMAISLNNLGLSLFLMGNLTTAESNLTQAMEVKESLRVGLSDEQKISIFDTQIGTYTALQLTLAALEKTNQALEISERGRARALIELLTKRFSSSQEEQKPTYPQTTEIKQIAKQQNATLVQYSVVGNQIYIWVISPQGRIDFVAVDIPDDITLKELIEQGKGCALDPNSKEKCRSNEIPTTFVPGNLVRFNDDEKSSLERPWRVTAFNPDSGMLSVTHPQFNDINVTVERHKSEVIPSGNNLEVQLKNLQKLHQILIAPIKQFLPENENDHVIFIPHQELFGVPFPALQDEQGTYLIKHHTILTAPSIQALKLTNQRRNTLGNKELSQSEFLIVGNPDMPNNPEKPGENVHLSALPFSEIEAKEIADLFNSQALIGGAATETTVVEKMKTADIIHLATHGLLGNYTGGSIPGVIALSADNTNDGLLTADELFDLENQLQAQLVVLSACDTGRGDITGDGIIGLSRSLIAAGTPSILVSLWKVPDDSTGELMGRFYEHLEASGNKAQALRQAMLETMEERPFPRDWAAFTLIGEAF